MSDLSSKPQSTSTRLWPSPQSELGVIDPKGRLMLPIVMINTFDYLLGMDIERREEVGEGASHLSVIDD